MASKGTTSSADESFTAMSVGDVEAIGAHCEMEYCRQLDFLPFRCESCHGKFCLDHRTESSHKCSKAGAWAKARAARNATSSSTSNLTPKPHILNHEQQCSHPQCKTLIDTPLTPGIHCQTCNRRYCLKHRMQEDHDCSKLTPLGARPSSFANQKERGLAALEKLKAWSISKKASMPSSSSLLAKAASPAKKSAAANLAAINALKAAAKGDIKIPPEKRIYLHVEASADTTKAKFPTGKFFYSKEWTIGRVLDAAAKSLQVENVNNRANDEALKLRVFHVEAGRLLEFSEKLGDVVHTGNTIVLLRGVGPPIPDLIEP
jgi:AN1-type zinc finger protein 1